MDKRRGVLADTYNCTCFEWKFFNPCKKPIVNLDKKRIPRWTKAPHLCGKLGDTVGSTAGDGKRRLVPQL